MHPSGIQLRLARDQLLQGRTIAYPTEGVFGLGCDPENTHAIEGLLELKGRAWNKGLILIAAEAGHLQAYTPINVHELEQKKQSRPTTWLVPRSDDVPDVLAGHGDEIAVRITSHVAAAALCRIFGGALISTSANPAGKKAATSRLDVHQYFGARVPCILAGNLGGLDGPSSIIRFSTGEQLR